MKKVQISAACGYAVLVANVLAILVFGDVARVQGNPQNADDSNHWHLAIGAFPDDGFYPTIGDTVSLDQWAAFVGAPSRFMSVYPTWFSASGTCQAFPASMLQQWTDQGALPVVIWRAAQEGTSAPDPNFQLARIAEGRYDACIEQFARGAATWGGRFVLRLFHEGNGAWDNWDTGVDPSFPSGYWNNNTPQDYVEAWRHVYLVFRDAYADGGRKTRDEFSDNVIWHWCPYRSESARSYYVPLAQIYPGDDFVTWTGMDAYNMATNPQSNSPGDDPETVLLPTYREILAIPRFERTKMMIGEVGTMESAIPGDKAQWIREAFEHVIPEEMPTVIGVSYFSRFVTQKDFDWRVDTSSDATAGAGKGSLDAYREVVRIYSR